MQYAAHLSDGLTAVCRVENGGLSAEKSEVTRMFAWNATDGDKFDSHLKLPAPHDKIYMGHAAYQQDASNSMCGTANGGLGAEKFGRTHLF
jgi:hypothetical protein